MAGCFFGSASGLLLAPALELPEPMAPVLDEEEPDPAEPEAEPGVGAESELPPDTEPEALPLRPPLAPGAELELPGAGVIAPGAELELLLELPGDGAVLGAELEPELLDEVPGRVASLDFCPVPGPRSQPVAASAIATAAATRVR